MPPLRALSIAALSALGGAILLVLWGSYAWSVAVAVVGVTLTVFGLALVLAAAIAYRRMRQTLILDETAITIMRGRRHRRLMWGDIGQVNLRGRRLQLMTKDDEAEPAEVIRPNSHPEPVFAALLQAISSRLDADRGYRRLD